MPLRVCLFSCTGLLLTHVTSAKTVPTCFVTKVTGLTGAAGKVEISRSDSWGGRLKYDTVLVLVQVVCAGALVAVAAGNCTQLS